MEHLIANINYKYELLKRIISGKIISKRINSENGFKCSYDEYKEFETIIRAGEKALDDLINIYAKYDEDKIYYDPYIAYIAIRWINSHFLFASFTGNTKYYEVVQDLLSDKKNISNAFDNFIGFCEKKFDFCNKNYDFDFLYNRICNLITNENEVILDDQDKKNVIKFLDINRKIIVNLYDDKELMNELYFINFLESKQFYNILHYYTKNVKAYLIEKIGISEEILIKANEYCKAYKKKKNSGNMPVNENDIINELEITKKELKEIKKTLSILNQNNSKKYNDYAKGNDVVDLYDEREQAIKEFEGIENKRIFELIDSISDKQLNTIISKYSDEDFKITFEIDKSKCNTYLFRNILKNKLMAGEKIWL